jgi:hypothetical protein
VGRDHLTSVLPNGGVKGHLHGDYAHDMVFMKAADLGCLLDTIRAEAALMFYYCKKNHLISK